MAQRRSAQTSSSHRAGAATAYAIVILAGFAAVLFANLPGHLSFDSVIQLYEGRTGSHISFNPPIMAWILGRFDAIRPGTGLFVVASTSLLAASLIALSKLRARTSWLAPLAAGLAFALPQMMLYPAIVWKDVLFANLSIAAFVCVGLAARAWDRRGPRIIWLLAALPLLAVAGLVRQNGLICTAAAAAALTWIAGGKRLWPGLPWGAGALVAVLAAAAAIGAAVQPPGSSMAGDTGRGLRVLQRYDIIGAAAHDPKLRFSALARADAGAADRIRLAGVRLYAPDRVDTLARDRSLRDQFKRLPTGIAAVEWREVLLRHTRPYLQHRAAVFRWLVAPPEPYRCLPYTTGVEGPKPMLDSLSLSAGYDRHDTELAAYARRFVGAPATSHVTYGVIAAVACLLCLWRRDQTDIAIAAMLSAALVFAASFFFISVACDYRYLYFLDLAAIVGVLYWALDPRISRSRAA